MANQRHDPDKRPSPDALLETARRENDQAGRLKIFVGAAPGVGKTYEMDLDGLLARRPQIALVDELAHTNAPGSRHPKRYLDVEELLSQGIDVYTAVNIQTSKASTMWWRRLPMCGCAKPSRTRCSTAPPRSS